MSRCNDIFALRCFPALAIALLWLTQAGCSESAAETPNGENGSAGETDWFNVTRTDFPLTVVASGELQAKRSEDIKNEVEGRSTIVYLIDEGESVVGPTLNEQGEIVEPGTLLVKLADDEIKERIEQETLNVERARSDFVAADQALEIHASEAESSRKAAQLKLDLAELELEKWAKGDVKKKRLELELGLKKAEHNLERARENLKLSEQLYKEQFISKQEVDDDRIALEEAENAVKTAKLDIETYEKFTHPKEQKKFNSDVEQAAEELKRTINKNKSDLEKYEADQISKKRTYELRRERLKALEEQYKKTSIYAPQSGLVVYATSVGRGRRRDEPLAQGQEVRFNQQLITLPDTSKMVASVRVHEAKLRLVEKGQPVTVKIAARQGQPIEGTVSSIAVMAESGGWFNPDLREYMVNVDLPEDSDSNLKPGMRCHAEILVGRVEDAVAVPIHAVQTRGRERFVYVPAAGGKVRQQPVTIGRASETLVEIKDGLEAGDRVLLRKPRAGEEMERRSRKDNAAT